MVELLTKSFHPSSTFRQTSLSDSYERNLYETSTTHKLPADVRIGAFRVRSFGRRKVENEDILNILVQVIGS